jgi:hypothetical protein
MKSYRLIVIVTEMRDDLSSVKPQCWRYASCYQTQSIFENVEPRIRSIVRV